MPSGAQRVGWTCWINLFWNRSLFGENKYMHTVLPLINHSISLATALYMQYMQ